MKKLNLAFFSLTCDEGCSVNFLETLNKKYEEWKDLINFKAFRLIQTREEIKGIDLALVEGVVSSKEEKMFVKKIRNSCKKLVTVGTCAASGYPSNVRNYFDKETLSEIKPILKRFGSEKKVLLVKNLVKVDDEVLGCPADEEKIIALIEKYLKKFGVLDARRS